MIFYMFFFFSDFYDIFSRKKIPASAAVWRQLVSQKNAHDFHVNPFLLVKRKIASLYTNSRDNFPLKYISPPVSAHML